GAHVARLPAVRLLLWLQRAGGEPAQHGVAGGAAACARRRPGRVQHPPVGGFLRGRRGRRVAGQERWVPGPVRDLRGADGRVVRRGLAHEGARTAAHRGGSARGRRGRPVHIEITSSDCRRNSMASVNKVIIVGNLGRDPEVRTFPSGDRVANVTIATTDKWKDKQTGEMKEATEWHRVVFNVRLAEIDGEYLRKGSQVYVEGSLRTRKWTGTDGMEKFTTEIRGDQMPMLG